MKGRNIILIVAFGLAIISYTQDFGIRMILLVTSVLLVGINLGISFKDVEKKYLKKLARKDDGFNASLKVK